MHCSMTRTCGPQIIILALDRRNSITNVDSNDGCLEDSDLENTGIKTFSSRETALVVENNI